MISPKFPIAVQALSMKMLYRICQIEPDFKPEIIAILEDINYQDYSSGFNSTRNSILKVLKKVSFILLSVSNDIKLKLYR